MRMRLGPFPVFFLPILFFLIVPDSSAQFSTFTIFKGDTEIGEIKAFLEETDNNLVKYTVESEVNFWVIWRYNRTSDLIATYKDDMLETSYSKIILNDDIKEFTKLKKEGEAYNCFKYPNLSFQTKPGVNFSVAKLYFEEPVGISRVYSEKYLTYAELEPQGDHTYKLILPGGKINYYTYQNQELVEVLVHRNWFNLAFRKKS